MTTPVVPRSTPEPKKTPLYETHVRLGGKIVEFGGWLLPVQYASILEEHRAVRQRAGAFDVSHLGKVEVTGEGALDFLQFVSTNDVAQLEVGQAQYALLCHRDGGIVDDIFVYRLPDRYLVVVNAATTEKDVAWLRRHGTTDVEIKDVTPDTATISVQGPDTLRIVQELVDVDLGSMKRNSIQAANVAGRNMLVAGTGYTGERGVEFFPSAGDAAATWDALLSLEAGITPCGLGARDTLRLEAGNRLYGHDMDDTVNPVEAALEWTVKMDKGDFIGREAIQRVLEGGVTRRITGFVMVERAVPREGCLVMDSTGQQQVGIVTSGSFSPSLNQNIGFAYVKPELTAPGNEFLIDVRGRNVRARAVETPFYRRRRARGKV
jgi:aminomethyltransferase